MSISFDALDTTVGGENSNSYGTLEELKAYFANRSEASTFIALEDDELIARMIQATMINDALLTAFGTIASGEQSLEFPRLDLVDRHGRVYESTIIPEKIKWAQFEQAKYLATNSISLPAILTQGFSEAKLDVMSIKLSKEFIPRKVSFDAIDYLELFGTVSEGDTKSVMLIRY